MLLPRTRRRAARDDADAATVTLQRRRSRSINRDFERLRVQHGGIFHGYDELAAILSGDPAVIVRRLAVRRLVCIGRWDGLAGRDDDATRLALGLEQPLHVGDWRCLFLPLIVAER